MNAQGWWKVYYRKAVKAKREGAESYKYELMCMATQYRREAALERKLEAAQREIERTVLAEREACAKICDEEPLHNPLISDEWTKHSNDRDEQVAFTHADRIAAAIRARAAEQRETKGEG
jgi:hypothetical protein